MGAAPPLEFGRAVQTPLRHVLSQAAKPAGDGPSGTALSEYAGEFRITEWLVLGPVDPPDAAKPIEGSALPDEPGLAPSEGDAVGALKWKRIEGAGGLDFSTVLDGKHAGKIAYVCAWFFAPEDFKCACLWRGRVMKQWVNGARSEGWERAKQPIKKGWNRIVVKVVCPMNQDLWDFKHSFIPHSDEKLAYAEKNVRWSTPLPSSGWAMPVIAGDKLFVTSEPNDLICLDKRDGKMLWMRSNPLWYAALEFEKEKLAAPAPIDPAIPAAEKPGVDVSKLLEELKPKIAELDKLNAACLIAPDWNKDEARRKLSSGITDAITKADRSYRVNIGWGGGNTGPTPVTDGKQIFAWFGETGVLACFDLEGNRIWTRFEKSGGGEHGVNSSPVLSGDILSVIAGGHWAAFDKHNGKPLWNRKYTHPSYATQVVARIAGVDVLIAPDGQVLRASDGELIAPSVGRFDGECASAVVDGNRFYLYARAGFCIVELPAKAEKGAGTKVIRMIDPKALDGVIEPYPVGSPVFYDGLLYVARSGWGAGSHDSILYAFDETSTHPVYKQKLDMEPVIFYGPEGGGVCASLMLSGGSKADGSGATLHVMDNRGTWISFKPGREYKQVARNKIDQWMRGGAREVTGVTPVLEGKRIYMRGREMLYCFEGQGD